MLLLWMSIIILVPFDLVTIDSQHMDMDVFNASAVNNPLRHSQKAEKCLDITTNLIEIGKYYLNSSTKLREASSKFLSNLFQRPDIQKTLTLSAYIDWSTQTIF